MAILESTDIPHPAIEALFTIDEETGMTGALNLKEESCKVKSFEYGYGRR
jgi:di/tripeptidase